MKLGRKRPAVFFERSRTQTGKMGGAGAAENQEKTGKKSTSGNFPSFVPSTARHGFAVRMPNPNAERRWTARPSEGPERSGGGWPEASRSASTGTSGHPHLHPAPAR